jgi:hypothetical protein
MTTKTREPARPQFFKTKTRAGHSSLFILVKTGRQPVIFILFQQPSLGVGAQWSWEKLLSICMHSPQCRQKGKPQMTQQTFQHSK